MSQMADELLASLEWMKHNPHLFCLRSQEATSTYLADKTWAGCYALVAVPLIPNIVTFSLSLRTRFSHKRGWFGGVRQYQEQKRYVIEWSAGGETFEEVLTQRLHSSLCYAAAEALAAVKSQSSETAEDTRKAKAWNETFAMICRRPDFISCPKEQP